MLAPDPYQMSPDPKHLFFSVCTGVFNLPSGTQKTDNPDVLYILTTVNGIAAEGTFRSFQVTRGFQAGLKGVSNIKRFLIIPTYKVPSCPLLTYLQVYSEHRCAILHATFLEILQFVEVETIYYYYYYYYYYYLLNIKRNFCPTTLIEHEKHFGLKYPGE
jgi:hypothetical protein